jgi:thiosulfate dehydrogenase [quinone] large subunit
MSEKACNCCLGSTLGFLTLRIWLALRAIVTGIEKFAGSKVEDIAVNIDGEPNTYGLTASEADKVYGMSHYHGVPAALYDKLAKEPLIPGFALKFFDLALGPVLILLGFTLLLGIATRISLFAMGLIYSGLTVGLILLKQDGGIAWLGIHILLIAFALFNAKHNRCALLKNL